MKTVIRGVLAAAAVMSAGCAMTKDAMANSNAPDLPMQGSSTVPAGEGMVKAVKDTSGNTALSVKVKHMAPANKLVEDAQVYVVWVEPPNGTPQNVGVLTLNANKEGTLNTVTPHHRFRVLITPESSGQVQQPSGEELFTGEVDRGD